MKGREWWTRVVAVGDSEEEEEERGEGDGRAVDPPLAEPLAASRDLLRRLRAVLAFLMT